MNEEDEGGGKEAESDEGVKEDKEEIEEEAETMGGGRVVRNGEVAHPVVKVAEVAEVAEESTKSVETMETVETDSSPLTTIESSPACGLRATMPPSEKVLQEGNVEKTSTTREKERKGKEREEPK